MKVDDIIRQLEHISQAPGTKKEHKVVIEKSCRMLRQQPNIDTVTSEVQLLANLAGIAIFIHHSTL